MQIRSTKLTLVLLVVQIVFIVLFGVMVEYDDEAHARPDKESILESDKAGFRDQGNSIQSMYPMFQDVHVMMFIGFGFLMTFLKRYGFGSVGFNLLVAAFVLQWAILMGGFLELHDGKIHVNITTLLTSDFTAAAILISMGAVLGKVSALQLIIMALCEVVIFKVNEHIGLTIFKAADMGGSMFVHVFGAYFGIAAARVLYCHDTEDAASKEGSVYHSDLFSMIGTIFLWLYWPSFNSGLAVGDDQHRAVINTYVALAACTVVSFAVSGLVNNGKMDMVHIQNATLAGGVAVGTTADMMIQPWGALVIGSVAGTISVLGYKYLSPFMASKLKMHDTCGVNNLHGMPGILAGIAGIVAAAVAKEKDYGRSLYQVFAARLPEDEEGLEALAYKGFDDPGDGRSAGEQAGFQAAALGLTLVMAIVGGAIVGLILRIPIWDQPRGAQVFDDSDYWELPEEGVPMTHELKDMTVNSENTKV